MIYRRNETALLPVICTSHNSQEQVVGPILLFVRPNF